MRRTIYIISCAHTTSDKNYNVQEIWRILAMALTSALALAELSFLSSLWTSPILSIEGFLTALLAILLVAGSLFLIALQYLQPPHKKLRQPNGKPYAMPPQPKGVLFFGNLLSLKYGLWENLRAWPKETGEFTTLQLGSTTWVLLNSRRVCNEILNKHGSVTNERPHLPVVQGLMSRNMRSVLMEQSDQYKENRRVYHQLLTGSNIARYGISQDLESTQLLAEHLLRPEDWYLNHGRYANSVINLIAFGKRTFGPTPLMKGILEVVHVFLRNNPPANLVDLFPAVTKLPERLQWWRKRAVAIGDRTYEVYSAYWRPVARAIRDGTAPPSFSRDVLNEEAGKYHGTEDEAMYLAAQLVEAGSDTTRAALNNLAMAMVAQPDFVVRLRAELDAVCGADAQRLPSFDDEEKLRLTMATVKEVLRWRCIFPLMPPHKLTQDLVFEGYVFPAGTNFVPNDPYISIGPEHEDPQRFYPERWLDGKECDVLNGLWAFGGGRRVCVGYRLAQRSLFINIAKIVYCFDFERVS